MRPRTPPMPFQMSSPPEMPPMPPKVAPLPRGPFTVASGCSPSWHSPPCSGTRRSHPSCPSRPPAPCSRPPGSISWTPAACRCWSAAARDRMGGPPTKSTDLKCEGVSLRFKYMKSVSSENGPYRASAANHRREVQVGQNWPGVDRRDRRTMCHRARAAGRISASCGGWQPQIRRDVEGPARWAGRLLAELIGCCARAADIAPAASSPARTAAMITRVSTRGSLAVT